MQRPLAGLTRRDHDHDLTPTRSPGDGAEPGTNMLYWIMNVAERTPSSAPRSKPLYHLHLLLHPIHNFRTWRRRKEYERWHPHVFR